MPQATARLLQVLCCVLVVAGLSGSAMLQAGQPDASPPGQEASVAGTDPGPALSDSTGGTGAEQPAAPGGTDASAAQPPAAEQPRAEEPAKAQETPADGPVSEALVKGTPVVASKEGGPLGPPGAWKLVLDEEFDTLNTSLWTPYWFRDCHPGSTKNGVKTCSSNVKSCAMRSNRAWTQSVPSAVADGSALRFKKH